MVQGRNSIYQYEAQANEAERPDIEYDSTNSKFVHILVSAMFQSV